MLEKFPLETNFGQVLCYLFLFWKLLEKRLLDFLSFSWYFAMNTMSTIERIVSKNLKSLRKFGIGSNGISTLVLLAANITS